MKKTINKTAFVSKPVAAAVGLAMGALVAANAQAVSISNDGIGEVLMFPYYTVNNGYDTNINITNTSADTVAFKIRFRESENSRDARDFNVVLSPYDVWNATITKNEQGFARLVTRDTSCTVGKLFPLEGSTASYVDFTNLDYVDGNALKNADGGSTTLARTNEGHIEVISMGRIPAGAEKGRSTGNATLDDAANKVNIAYNAKHVGGEPRSCDNVRAMFTKANIEDARGQFRAAGNALKGSVSFLNANSGKAITSEPTVLADFYNPDASTDNLVVLPETQAPGLHDVFPTEATWHENGVVVKFEADASSAVDAVSALIMRTGVVNQYSVNPVNNAQTDWVVTFPTKHYYVDERDPLANVVDKLEGTAGGYYRPYVHRVTKGDYTANPVKKGVAVAPFKETFQIDNNACAGVGVSFNFFDREEEVYTPPSTVGFSPAEPGMENTICKEVQVVTFNNSNLFGSPDSANVDVAAAGFNSGWMSMDFADSAGVSDSKGLSSRAGVPITLDGYPVIGFSATTLENGTAGDFMLNYGFSANHGYTRGTQNN